MAETTHKKAYINFYSPIWPGSVSALMNVIQQKIQQGTDKIILLISSSGGQVKAGLTLYKFLKRIPVELETHNYGYDDSIAVAIFCAGKKRFCVEDGRFFMHEIGHNIPKGKRLEPKELRGILKNLEEERDTIVKIIAENCGRKAEEIAEDMENTKGLDAKAAKEYGLAHEIKEELFPKGAGVVIVSVWPPSLGR